MQYTTKLVELSPLIEEEAVLEIHGQRIVAFINNCPFEIDKGGQYLIEIELSILDDFIISQADSDGNGIKQIENGFSHFISGILNIDSGTIDVGTGILFEIDREFLFDYGYLHNQYVQIRVDRLSVDFIG
ncbi:hypothetical protein ACFPVX_21710 [Cohnella faecalis]|uniref:Uncharacterized protein n=1 Tax=Cohnella faecalis TaxID=2315694 RepID=A0A398CSJ4_9BACL|nr:hypothetical protein [Cohnella faecalis]RIE05180.1 hypothetical protein D3H35_02080 [Cohnella faecalis]